MIFVLFVCCCCFICYLCTLSVGQNDPKGVLIKHMKHSYSTESLVFAQICLHLNNNLLSTPLKTGDILLSFSTHSKGNGSFSTLQIVPFVVLWYVFVHKGEHVNCHGCFPVMISFHTKWQQKQAKNKAKFDTNCYIPSPSNIISVTLRITVALTQTCS